MQLRGTIYYNVGHRAAFDTDSMTVVGDPGAPYTILERQEVKPTDPGILYEDGSFWFHCAHSDLGTPQFMGQLPNATGFASSAAYTGVGRRAVKLADIVAAAN